jgi:hypothetical protein
MLLLLMMMMLLLLLLLLLCLFWFWFRFWFRFWLLVDDSRRACDCGRQRRASGDGYLRPHGSAVRARARGLLRGHAAVRAGPGRPARAVDMGRRGVRHATDNFSTAAMRPTLQEYVERAARAGRGDGRTHQEVQVQDARGGLVCDGVMA